MAFFKEGETQVVQGKLPKLDLYFISFILGQSAASESLMIGRLPVPKILSIVGKILKIIQYDPLEGLDPHIFGPDFCQKNPRVRKIRVRDSGAGNGCANFMDTWKNAFFLQENPCP